MLFSLIAKQTSFAQTNTFPSTGAAGIGTVTPDTYSLLDMVSTSKGILIPRMTKIQRDAIAILPATPPLGLMIYQTNNTPGFYYYNGSAWKPLAPAGVNKTLSNLTSPTAINVSILPGTNGNIDLGSSSFQWRNGYLTGTLKVGSYTLPSTDGTSGQALSTNGSGTIGWSNIVNSSLSNLTSPTAINVNLLPGTNNTLDFGSPSFQWHNGYLTGTLKIGSYTLPSTDGTSGQVLKTNGAGTLTWNDNNSSQWTTSGANIYYNAGNVGIGTVSPTRAKLETVGSIGNTLAMFGQNTSGVSFTGANPGIWFNSYFNSGIKSMQSGYGASITADPGTGRIIFSEGNNPGGADLAATQTEVATILNTGNVGIGTNNPVDRLSVNSAFANVARFDGAPGMFVGLYESGTYRGYIGSYSGNAADVDFGTGSGNTLGNLNLTIQGVPKLTLTSGGNVGIGTTSPTRAKLETAGSIGNTLAMFGQNTSGVSFSGAYPGIWFNSYFNGSAKSMQSGYGASITADPGTGRIIFSEGNNPGGADLAETQTEVATILNNGNFGLGLSNPSHTLDVTTSTLSNTVKITNVRAGTDTLLFLQHTGGNNNSSNIGVMSDLSSYSQYSGNYGGLFVADYRGVVGEANDNLGNQLSAIAGVSGLATSSVGTSTLYGVRGNILYGNSSSYAGYFIGNVYATGTFIPSDATLKEDIKSYKNALTALNQLPVKQYQYKKGGIYDKMNLPSGNQVGVLAQDIEKIYPGMVHNTEFEDPAEKQDGKRSTEKLEFKAVNYTALVPVLIEAVQELSAQNDKITNENVELKSRLDKLESMMLLLQNQSINSNAASQTSSQSVELGLSAKLEQNIPNPFTNTTTINYYLPVNKGNAYINFYSTPGAVLKSVKLTAAGKGTINVRANELPSGAYQYALVIDGKIIDTKQMVQAK